MPKTTAVPAEIRRVEEDITYISQGGDVLHLSKETAARLGIKDGEPLKARFVLNTLEEENG